MRDELDRLIETLESIEETADARGVTWSPAWYEEQFRAIRTLAGAALVELKDLAMLAETEGV